MALRVRERGYLLMLVMLCMTVILFFASVLLRTVGAGNRQVTTLESTWSMEAAADAGLAEARLRLSSDASWKAGLNGRLPHSDVTYRVVFGPSTGPYSTNNAAGDKAVSGWQGRTVPPGTAHIVVEAARGSRSYLLQALISATGLLLHSTFDETDVPPAGWTITRGVFAMQKGSYVGGTGPAGRAAVTYAGKTSWRNYRYDVTARCLFTAKNPGSLLLIVRAPWEMTQSLSFTTNPGIYVPVDAFPKSFSFVWGHGTPQNKYATTRSPQVMLSGTALASWATNWTAQPHKYSLACNGKKISFFVDDNFIMSTEVDRPENARGRVGLFMEPNSQWAIDEVKVTTTGKAEVISRW